MNRSSQVKSYWPPLRRGALDTDGYSRPYTESTEMDIQCNIRINTPVKGAACERAQWACATAAAKPTSESAALRSVEIMKDRASSMERAPSERH